MFEFLARGGVLMIPLGVCSILALAIVLERTLNLRTKKIIQLDILQQVRDLVAENQVSDAMTLCRRYPSVMGRILLVTIANHDRDREELRSVVEDAGRQEVTTLDRNLGALGTIAAIAPLLGLTGTVFGMIRTFAIISEKGIAHPSQLAGGNQRGPHHDGDRTRHRDTHAHFLQLFHQQGGPPHPGNRKAFLPGRRDAEEVSER